MQIDGVRILVLDRARIKVGYLSRCPDLAFHWLLRGARIIRRWGTTEGLEQIARDGPTPETILDRPCDCLIPFRGVLEILDAEEAAWLPHLTPNVPSGARRNAKAPSR